MINMDKIKTKAAESLETLYIYTYIDTIFIRRENSIYKINLNKVNKIIYKIKPHENLCAF